jgi:hypothetical protein
MPVRLQQQKEIIVTHQLEVQSRALLLQANSVP